MKKYNLLVIAKLGDKTLLSKLAPLSKVDTIENIHLVRRYPLKLEKVLCHCPSGLLQKNMIASELYRVFTIVYLCLFKNIDIIMGIQFVMHGVYAAIAGILFRKPVIQNMIESEKKVYRNWLFRTSIRRADIIITRGNKTKKFLVEHGFDWAKIVYVPNVFDFDRIPLPENRDKIYDLIYVGSFTPSKRIDILLDSIKLVKQKYGLETIRVVVLGEGPLKKKIIAYRDNYDLKKNIIFAGFQKDVSLYLNKSKIFIMTSEYEGLPMAMIEAMSCGLPCIMPDVGNITTVAIHNYNSLIVPPCDADAFAESIYKLMIDKDLYERLSRNALKIREEKRHEYSSENIKNVWKEILSKIN